MKKIRGTIEFKDLGMGVWILTTSEGKVYELLDVPEQVKRHGSIMSVWLEINPGMATMAMVGTPGKILGFEYD